MSVVLMELLGALAQQLPELLQTESAVSQWLSAVAQLVRTASTAVSLTAQSAVIRERLAGVAVRLGVEGPAQRTALRSVSEQWLSEGLRVSVLTALLPVRLAQLHTVLMGTVRTSALRQHRVYSARAARAHAGRVHAAALVRQLALPVQLGVEELLSVQVARLVVRLGLESQGLPVSALEQPVLVLLTVLSRRSSRGSLVSLRRPLSTVQLRIVRSVLLRRSLSSARLVLSALVSSSSVLRLVRILRRSSRQ